MNEKKKTTKLGKVWIIVCVLATVLGLLLAFVGPIASEMEYYNNHEHQEWCFSGGETTSDCPYYHGDAFSYAFYYQDGLMACIVFGIGALAAANVVMLFVWLGRKGRADRSAKESTVPVNSAPIAVAVPAPSAEEQVILKRGMFFNWFTITVTNKRVIYKGILWSRMTLPLNRITATATGIFCSLSIGSSAGRIMMIFFRHYREVYDTINALLNEVK